MKIVVYGLGIIGASMAAALKNAGHTVLGRNRSRAALDYALEHDMICGEATSYEGADVVILALPPEITEKALEDDYPEGCIVCDICGVKRKIERAAFAKPRKYFYVGTHPMAGKETSGITSADANLFRGKNLVLTVCEQTNREAFELVKSLGKDAGFGCIQTCSAEEHDKKIALTSQLAHVVSNAYIKSAAACGVSGFTGGSFQDMTRVGGVDENLWTELYFANADFLLKETQDLIARLNEYCSVLKSGDEEAMRRLLREGKIAFQNSFCEK